MLRISSARSGRRSSTGTERGARGGAGERGTPVSPENQFDVPAVHDASDFDRRHALRVEHLEFDQNRSKFVQCILDFLQLISFT